MVSLRNWRRRLYRRVIRLRGTPHAVARGMAVGVVFGVLIPPGLQLAVAIPVVVLLGGNVFAAAVGTLVSNPVTCAPLYYFTFRVGALFLDVCGAEIPRGNVRQIISSVMNFNFSGLGGKLGVVLLSWATGGLIVGLAASVPFYYLTYWAVAEARKLGELRRSRRAAAARAAALPPPTREPDEEPPPGPC